VSPDEASAAPGGAGRNPYDIFGPLERSGAVRGGLLAVAAVVIGVLVMPAATRPPLAVSIDTAAGAATSTTSTTTTTTAAATTTLATAGRTTTTTAHAPTPSVAVSSIRVLVANGTNHNGAAAAVSSFLSGKGFLTLSPVDALTTVPATQVYAVNGAAIDADEVASMLGLPTSTVEPSSMPVPVSSTGNANVVVVVGPDILPRSG